MKHAFRTVATAALIFGIGSLAFAQPPQGHNAAMQHGGAMQPGAGMQHSQMMGNMPAQAGSRQLHQSMMSGMQDMQRKPLTGDVDKDFLRMMRQHHLQGIEMARIQLQSGDDAEAKRMAQKMIDEQQKDIAHIDSWLQRHQ